MEVITPQKRSTFLSVLCILSFLGSGFSLFNNIMGMIVSPIFNFFNPSIFQEALSNVKEPIAREFVGKAFEIAQHAMDHAFEIACTNSILYACSLLGAILMFKLKKSGFYLYIFAQIAILFVPALFIGFNIITNMGILMGSFMTIVFIILYSINYKHLQ